MGSLEPGVEQEMPLGMPTSSIERRKQANGCLLYISALWERLTTWLLEVEMGVVWCVASLAIISFIFASIWYIDPALLTMVLQFQAAQCTTIKSAYLIGISNCTWSSCRHGCTAEVYKCWQVQVNFTLVPKSAPIPPPWGSLSSLSSVMSSSPSLGVWAPNTNAGCLILIRTLPSQ